MQENKTIWQPCRTCPKFLVMLGKSWITEAELRKGNYEYVTAESIMQQNLGLNHVKLGQNESSL